LLFCGSSLWTGGTTSSSANQQINKKVPTSIGVNVINKYLHK
jgi:hypothetical protein